nr:MAG TPA: hypothetical protein [Caudoviricetes sp.]
MISNRGQSPGIGASGDELLLTEESPAPIS